MRLKQKAKCTSCCNYYHNVYGPKLDLCRACFNRGNFQTMIPKGPLIFNEEVSVNINIAIGVTDTQSKQIERRLNYLFPERKKEWKFSKINNYIRLLILNDIDSQTAEVEDERQ